MTFFDRLEVTYLNVLRVVILVLATLFLLGAIGASINFAQKLIPDTAKSDPRKLVTSDSLQDFRATQSGSPMDAAAAPSGPTQVDGPHKIDSRIKKAATSLVGFLTQQKGMSVGQAPVETLLSEKQLSLPENLQGDYADSLVLLMDNLARSKDASVDPGALLQWHYEKFEAAKEAAAAEEAARQLKNAANLQQGLIAGGAALSAFFLFLVVVFGFVLVKIERNLRLVNVVLPEGAVGTASGARIAAE